MPEKDLEKRIEKIIMSYVFKNGRIVGNCLIVASMGEFGAVEKLCKELAKAIVQVDAVKEE